MLKKQEATVNMLNKINIINIFCLLQAVVFVTTSNRIDELVQNYSEIIHKMSEQLKNLTTNTYKNSSEQVVHILNNNSLELTQTKDFLREMQSGKQNILTKSGMEFFPQITKECQDNFDQASEDLSKTIDDGEEVCLIFISNVFALVENPVLYKNISELQFDIDSIKINCTNTTYVSEAENCFKNEIYSVMPSRMREIREEVNFFLEEVHRKAKQMTDTLHRCYSIIQNDVLIKKVRKSTRAFQKCVLNKNMNH